MYREAQMILKISEIYCEAIRNDIFTYTQINSAAEETSPLHKQPVSQNIYKIHDGIKS
jgi:hypothetical protein